MYPVFISALPSLIVGGIALGVKKQATKSSKIEKRIH